MTGNDYYYRYILVLAGHFYFNFIFGRKSYIIPTTFLINNEINLLRMSGMKDSAKMILITFCFQFNESFLSLLQFF